MQQEGKGRNNNKNGDECLARRNNHRSDDNRQQHTDQQWDSHRQRSIGRAHQCTHPHHRTHCTSTTRQQSTHHIRPRDFVKRVIIRPIDRRGNIDKQLLQLKSQYVRNIDRCRTQPKRHIDDDNRHDKARKHLLNAIIANANTGNLRINHDERDDNKGDIG